MMKGKFSSLIELILMTCDKVKLDLTVMPFNKDQLSKNCLVIPHILSLSSSTAWYMSTLTENGDVGSGSVGFCRGCVGGGAEGIVTFSFTTNA